MGGRRLHLAFAAFLLSAGAISDRIGARQAFGGGLVLFLLASAACGLAPDLGVLVAARLVQGAGAAMSLSIVIGFALNVGFYGMIFLVGLYLQQVRGLSAPAAGVAFLPMVLLTAVVGPLAARLSMRFGARVPMVIGQALMTTGLLAMSTAPVSAPIGWVVTLMIPIGAGGALAVTALTALLLDSVPAERAGIASSVLNASRQIGGALAVAVFGALVAGSAGFGRGLQVSLLIAAAVVVAAVLATLLLRPAQSR